jgi:hypothetical protein
LPQTALHELLVQLRGVAQAALGEEGEEKEGASKGKNEGRNGGRLFYENRIVFV